VNIRALLAADPDVGAGNVLHKLIEHGAPLDGPGMGFDVAASGKGDLTVFYVDEFQRPNFWLRLLFTCRTDDWHFIKTVLFALMQVLPQCRWPGTKPGWGGKFAGRPPGSSGATFIRSISPPKSLIWDSD